MTMYTLVSFYFINNNQVSNGYNCERHIDSQKLWYPNPLSDI